VALRKAQGSYQEVVGMIFALKYVWTQKMKNSDSVTGHQTWPTLEHQRKFSREKFQKSWIFGKNGRGKLPQLLKA
jgi:hypothetical protein